MKAPSARTQVRRLPERGAYERKVIDAILDEGLVCHLGLVHEGAPFVIPTLYARDGDRVLVHGSAASRALRALDAGVPACITVTLLDGLVLARSAFHHSANYRSVMLLGTAEKITDRDAKLEALETISEHLVPGRWRDVRPPSAKELLATTVLAMPIDEASAKVRTGPPGDDEEDYARETWAGIIPLEMVPGPAVPDPRLRPGIATPRHVQRYALRSRRP